MARLVLLLLVSLGFSAPTPASANPELLLFAAASLTESVQEIATAFQTRTGTRVTFSFGSSGDLARQIEAGAPADAFLSADTGMMDRIEAKGLVRREERREFLSNTLVVVVPADSTTSIGSAGDLAALPKLALADPASVPAGLYARRWLEDAGVWKQIEPKVVPTLDVRACLAAVGSGAVPAGVVYVTDAAVSEKVRVAWVVADGPRILYSFA
ncbi:MAG TPA: molybdate ABC transporter substrate-binding protein, partial [Thermoanaerobaculia bacterium]